eukprot:TRINITY_DN3858_c0_g1_i10.p2 TRINITY_DN3858_c0_g1~~TRINITY_DN3858_c0_g1_i10.p2  ORF type:complete len:153 (+),score=16.49 TRINITY_DN3858_c0_g1_i10:82-540(+)
MTEENAVERLAEDLRRGGYAETVDLVVTAEWAGRFGLLDFVTLAVRVSEVGELDLSECTALTTLGSHFLDSCSALESVRLPPSVSNIGDDMMSGSGTASSPPAQLWRACASRPAALKSVDLSSCTSLTTLGERVEDRGPAALSLWTCRRARR